MTNQHCSYLTTCRCPHIHVPTIHVYVCHHDPLSYPGQSLVELSSTLYRTVRGISHLAQHSLIRCPSYLTDPWITHEYHSTIPFFVSTLYPTVAHGTYEGVQWNPLCTTVQPYPSIILSHVIPSITRSHQIPYVPLYL